MQNGSRYVLLHLRKEEDQLRRKESLQKANKILKEDEKINLEAEPVKNIRFQSALSYSPTFKNAFTNKRPIDHQPLQNDLTAAYSIRPFREKGTKSEMTTQIIDRQIKKKKTIKAQINVLKADQLRDLWIKNAFQPQYNNVSI